MSLTTQSATWPTDGTLPVTPPQALVASGLNTLQVSLGRRRCGQTAVQPQAGGCGNEDGPASGARQQRRVIPNPDLSGASWGHPPKAIADQASSIPAGLGMPTPVRRWRWQGCSGENRWTQLSRARTADWSWRPAQRPVRTGAEMRLRPPPWTWQARTLTHSWLGQAEAASYSGTDRFAPGSWRTTPSSTEPSRAGQHHGAAVDTGRRTAGFRQECWVSNCIVCQNGACCAHQQVTGRGGRSRAAGSPSRRKRKRSQPGGRHQPVDQTARTGRGRRST